MHHRPETKVGTPNTPYRPADDEFAGQQSFDPVHEPRAEHLAQPGNPRQVHCGSVATLGGGESFEGVVWLSISGNL